MVSRFQDLRRCALQIRAIEERVRPSLYLLLPGTPAAVVGRGGTRSTGTLLALRMAKTRIARQCTDKIL